MNTIQSINDRIIKLKQLKLETETRLARELYKKMEHLLGENFSLQLVTTILEENWNNASPEKKELWRSKAHPFPVPKTSRPSEKNQKKIDSTLP